MSAAVGLDRLLERLRVKPELLSGRRYGLLCHQASVDRDLRLCHLALVEEGYPPHRLFAPEHGFYGVEQDMVAALADRDPLSGCEIVSLYGESEQSLRPNTAAFEGLDLLLIDLQDIGARYYTFAATAVWAAEVALEAGCEVWVLDRPNPLGGQVIEGNRVESSCQSFVSAFPVPVRHGLSMGEMVRLQLAQAGSDLSGLTVFACDWPECSPASLADRFVAPSPNMPTLQTVFLYPGMCLLEGTELSEGRGTTRPFQLVGAPFIDPGQLTETLERRMSDWSIGGVSIIPSYFRPQFQKHAGEVCGGVELVVRDPLALDSFRFGVLLVATVRDLWPEHFEWRFRAYEFVEDRPAIDLLAGTDALRLAVDGGDQNGLLAWVDSWRDAEQDFAAARAASLLYERADPVDG